MKFVTEKDRAFFHRVNKELIQGVVEQVITYYAILAEKTRADDLYNESIKKVWSAPLRLNALVYYENTQERITELPPDSQYKLDVYFHTDELKDRNLVPKMGDFVKFGKLMYEITSVSETQPIAGDIGNLMMVKCPCVPARRGQFAPPDPVDIGVRTPVGFPMGRFGG